MIRQTYPIKWMIMISFMALTFLSSCGGGSREDRYSNTDNRRSSSSSRSNSSLSVDLSRYRPLAGKEFNKFFPKKSGDYKVNFSQEKKGTSQAKLKESGKEVATLTITDLATNPISVKKYIGTSSQVGGLPARSIGSLGTAILVGSRFQIQVRSKDRSFTASDREAWIKKFDLRGLERLSPLKSGDINRNTGSRSSDVSSEPSTTTPAFSLDLSRYKPLAGKEFNKFFPKKSGDYKVNFSQEKKGTSQAKLKKSGKEVAILTVTDLAANPRSRDKYLTSNAQLERYPLKSVGSSGTSILVGERFQVQVRSKDRSFTASDRETWLKKFNLKSIANLNNKNKK